MYEIRVDMDRRLIHDKLVGFWDVATAERFVEEITAAIHKVAAGGPGWKILGNHQDLQVQTPEVAAILAKVPVYAEANGIAKGAVYMPGALSKLQIKRMDQGGKFRAFDTEDEARAWLEHRA